MGHTYVAVARRCGLAALVLYALGQALLHCYLILFFAAARTHDLFAPKTFVQAMNFLS
jgi:hypothetical protein